MKEFNSELCDERHNNIKETHERIFKEITKVSKGLIWFLLLTISTLAAGIANLLIK